MKHTHDVGDFEEAESFFDPSAIDDDDAWLFDEDDAILLLGPW